MISYKKNLLIILFLLTGLFSFSQSNVLVIDFANSFSSDQTNNNSIIYNRLLATQTSVTRVNTFPASISAAQYDQVWIFGNTGVPTPTTLAPIISYMNSGGAVYIQSEVSCCNNQAMFADALIDSTVIVGNQITHSITKSGNYEYVSDSNLLCNTYIGHGAALRPFMGTPSKNVLFEATSTCGSPITTGDVVGVRFGHCDMISGKGSLIVNGDFNIFPTSGSCSSVGILGTPNDNIVIDLISDLLPALACDTGNGSGNLILTATPVSFCGTTQLGWYFNGGGPGCPIIGCNQDTTYKWEAIAGEPINVGVNFSCDTCPYPTAWPSIPTTYTLTITVGDTTICNNGFGGIVTPITVYPQPLPNLGQITYTADCQGNVTLTSSGHQQGIQWQEKQNSIWTDIVGADSSTTTISNVSNGDCFRAMIYTVCDTIYTDSICPIIPMGPTAAFTINPTGQSLANTPVTFTDNSTGNVVNWSWDFGDGDSSNIQNPIHIYPNNGNYNITLIVTDTNGCSDTIVVPYSIISNIIKPNVITPNGDGQNDFLVFENLEFYDNNLKIFNRWGTIMFETINYKNNWDGDDLSEGTYFYILEVQKDGETELHKGTISLLR